MKAPVRDASDPAAIEEAAALLRAGRLVAFPTETVYGLGAHALDGEAVARIFAAKGRPASNPVIVHVADVDGARALAGQWPPVAGALAERFWPGPLTLVVPKAAAVPDGVTAGGPTVGLRVPAHPAALTLLRAAGVPVAAPSANRSMEVSPTTARHVADSLGDAVDLILDGGPTRVGLESTVLDVTVSPPRILRPGMVTQGLLRQAGVDVATGPASGGAARSPGLMLRHYAPRVPVVLIDASGLLGTLRAADGVLFLDPQAGDGQAAARAIVMPSDAAGYAARLYAALRELDEAGVRRIVVEVPPRDGDWIAIHDRLRRAATRDEDTQERNGA